MSIRRALLIGLTAPDLPGISPAVDAIAGLLERRYRFEPRHVTRLIDPRGDMIKRAFGELARDTRPGDVVVVYYAGHGSLFRSPLHGAEGRLRHPMLVTPDAHEPGLGRFRGVLGSELSRLIRVLALKTDNVTVILDCCFAADMLRVEDDGLDDPTFVAAETEVQRLAQERVQGRRVSRSAAPAAGEAARVVLLLASASGGKSFPDPESERDELLFTQHLVAALDNPAAAGRTWLELMSEIRRDLRKKMRAQLPSVAGARHRKPFTTIPGVPGVGFVEGRVEGGRIVVETAGLAVDELYDVYQYTWSVVPEAQRITSARVVETTAATAILRPQSWAELPATVYVRRREDAEAGTPLVVGGGVAAAVGRHQSWVPTGNWRHARDAEDPVARIEVDGGALVLVDHHGERYAEVASGRPEPLVDALERARMAWRVDGLLARPELCELGGCFEIGWGRLERDSGSFVAAALAPDAEFVADGPARMFFRVRNVGVLPRLYARAYRLRVDRELVHWEDVADGVYVGAGDTAYLGDQSCGPMRGIALEWPQSTPRAWFRGRAASEWAVICVADVPISRTFLNGAVERGVTRSGPGDGLFSLLAVSYRLSP